MSETPDSLPRSEPLQWQAALLAALATWLLTLTFTGLLRTRDWPLVNDGALQHYITFLTDSGLAPYREIEDMNLPGSLLLDRAVVHTLGPGPRAWRAFDALLLLAAAASFLPLTRARRAHPASWFPGLFAATLFALLHLRDGMGQTGQRDLSEAVLLLAATAFSFTALRRQSPSFLAAVGLCAGAALTIKPDSAIFSAALLLLTLHRWRSLAPRLILPLLLPALLGALIAPLAALAWLLHLHAVLPFWRSLTEITPFYASLGRLPLLTLLRDCLPASVRVLALLGLAAALLTPAPPNPSQHLLDLRWERRILLLGTLWGLASFLLQAKGYPYHRYPTLAFLLPLLGLVYLRALESQRRPALFAGLTGLLYATLSVAPASLHRALHATWNESLIHQLDADLTTLGATASGHPVTVQCLDSISGCNTALLRLHLAEPQAALSDFLLFGPATQPAVRRSRAAFLPVFEQHPPTLLVVTGWLHPAGLDHYGKLALWPALTQTIASRYALLTERTFPPGANGPLSYRIYRLRPSPELPATPAPSSAAAQNSP